MCISQASHTSVGWEDAEPHNASSSWLELEQLSIAPRASQLQEEQSAWGHGSLALGQDGLFMPCNYTVTPMQE